MILPSEVADQPLALGVFLALGLGAGVAAALLLLWQYCFRTRIWFTVVSETALTLVCGGAFAALEVRLFDYSLRAYHFFIFFAAAGAGFWIVRRLTCRFRDGLRDRATRCGVKFKASKIYRKIVK